MKDVVQYERTIGDLLERNTALSAQLTHHQQQRDNYFESRLTNLGTDVASIASMVMRLSEQQSRQMDRVLALLAAMQTGTGVAVDPKLTDALTSSALYANVISRVIGVRAVEKIRKRSVPLAEDMAVRAIRGSLSFDEGSNGSARTIIDFKENEAEGVHSVIFPISGVDLASLRGVVLEVRPQAASVVRIRLKQANDLANRADVDVDLMTGQHSPVATAHMGGRRTALVDVSSDG